MLTSHQKKFANSKELNNYFFLKLKILLKFKIFVYNFIQLHNLPKKPFV